MKWAVILVALGKALTMFISEIGDVLDGPEKPSKP